MTAASAARDEVLQVFGRGIELMRQSFQVFSLQPVVLSNRDKDNEVF